MRTCFGTGSNQATLSSVILETSSSVTSTCEFLRVTCAYATDVLAAALINYHLKCLPKGFAVAARQNSDRTNERLRNYPRSLI
jgi:hypothetical protein